MLFAQLQLAVADSAERRGSATRHHDMSTTHQTPPALDVPAGSGRPWTTEDVAELKRLYEDGGDKACLPIRMIAHRLGRSESAVWSKLLRVYPNNRDEPQPSKT